MLKTLLIALLVAAVIVTTTFSLDERTDNRTLVIKDKGGKPIKDYYARGIKLSTFAQDGRLRYQMLGEQLTHFKDPYKKKLSRLELEKPQARILSGKWQDWRVQSAWAKRLDRDNQWDFSGKVSIEKANQTSLPFKMDTQQLVYEPQSHALHTLAHVTLTYPYGTSASDGIKIDLASEKVQLLSNVESHFYPSSGIKSTH